MKERAERLYSIGHKMLAWDIFRRYLFSKRSGSLISTIAKISILGITLGVFSFILVLNIMNGFNHSMQKRYLSVEPHIVIKKDLNNKDLNFIKSMTEINEIDTYETQDVFLSVNGIYSGAIAKAYKDHGLKRITNYDDQLKNNEILIGQGLAVSLGVLEGDEIVILPPESLLLPPGEVPDYKKVIVKSILQTNVPDYDSKYVFYLKGSDLSQLQNLSTLESGYELRVKKPKDPSPYINKILKQSNVLKATDIESWLDRNSILIFALKVEKITIGAFLSLSAIIASFSIISILYLLMIQKKQDIGILLTMGLSIKKTKRLFTTLGLFLSSIGVGLGLSLGLFVSWILEKYPIPILPDIYFDPTIPAKIDPTLVLYAIIASCILGFITAWIPTHFLVRYSPIEALKK